MNVEKEEETQYKTNKAKRNVFFLNKSLRNSKFPFQKLKKNIKKQKICCKLFVLNKRRNLKVICLFLPLQ